MPTEHKTVAWIVTGAALCMNAVIDPGPSVILQQYRKAILVGAPLEVADGDAVQSTRSC